MANETVLINIKIEGTENEAKINSFSASIIKLQEENKKLAETNKTLAKAEGDNSAEIAKNTSQIEANKQKISEGTASRKGLIQTIQAEDNSIKALTVRNAELIKERNLINTSTKEGQKQIAAINAQLDANNAKIKDNSSALEKQRMNVGNYKSALDGLVPGLGGMIDGLEGATNSAKAFIATPLGAILGAIGLALAAFSAYFNSSEDSQNRWNKVVAFGTGLLERFMNVVEDVGGFLVDSFVGGLEAVGSVLDGFASSIGINTQVVKDFFNEVGNEAKKFADLQASIDTQERNLLIKRAETAKEVAKLRQEALSQEGAAKRKTVNEAIELERSLSQVEVDLAKKRETLAMEELKRNGDDKEAKKAVFEATAARINQEAEFFQATLRFAKEIEKLNDEETKQKEKLNEQRAIELEQKQNLEQVNQRLSEQSTFEIEASPIVLKNKLDVNAAQNALNKANKEAQIQNKETINNQSIQNRNTQLLANSLGQLGNVLKEQTALSKGLSSAQAIINTWLGVTNILADKTIPTLLKGFAIAANIATGLAAVAKINGVKFAKGGIAAVGGILNGPSHANGGIPFAVGGRVGFEAEGGEAIINKRSTAMYKPLLSQINQAGGGVPFATGGIASNEIRIASNQAMRNSVPQMVPVLVLQDFEAKQYDKNETISIAQVI